MSIKQIPQLNKTSFTFTGEDITPLGYISPSNYTDYCTIDTENSVTVAQSPGTYNITFTVNNYPEDYFEVDGAPAEETTIAWEIEAVKPVDLLFDAPSKVVINGVSTRGAKIVTTTTTSSCGGGGGGGDKNDLTWTLSPSSASVGSSGGTCTFYISGTTYGSVNASVSGSASCSISGSTITVTIPAHTSSYTRSFTLSVSAAGNSSYNSRSLTAGIELAAYVPPTPVYIYVDIPEWSSIVHEFYYNGEEKQVRPPVDIAYTCSGTKKATNAGEYELTFSLTNTSIYRWEDGTVGDKYLTWYIYKASLSLSCSPTSLNFGYSTSSQTDTVSVSGAHGRVTASASTGTYFSAYAPNAGLVSISCSKTGYGSASDTIIITAAGTTNYESATIYCSVSYSAPKTTVSPPSWKSGVTAEYNYGNLVDVASSTYWNNWDTTYFTYRDCSGYSVGTFTATFACRDGYLFDSSGTTLVTRTWYIRKRALPIPYQSNTLTYTGTSQSPTWANDPGGYAQKSGTTSAINANTTSTPSYTTTFTIRGDLTGNFYWSGLGYTSTTVDATWTIQKANQSWTVSPNSISKYTSSSALMVALTISGSCYGSVGFRSTNTNIATGSSAQGLKIVIPANSATGTATVTISYDGGTNYNSYSLSITVTVSARTPINIPTWKNNLTYNGSERIVNSSTYWNNWSNYFTVSGDYTGTDAGTYTITFTCDDSHIFSNGNILVSANWYIIPVYLTIPSLSGTLTYNGSSLTPTWSNEPSSTIVTKSVTALTNAGTNYIATFTIQNNYKTNYRWSNAGEGTWSVLPTWSIQKANWTISNISSLTTVNSPQLLSKSDFSPEWSNMSWSYSVNNKVECSVLAGDWNALVTLRATSGYGTVSVTATPDNNNFNNTTFIVSWHAYTYVDPSWSISEQDMVLIYGGSSSRSIANYDSNLSYSLISDSNYVTCDISNTTVSVTADRGVTSSGTTVTVKTAQYVDDSNYIIYQPKEMSFTVFISKASITIPTWTGSTPSYTYNDTTYDVSSQINYHNLSSEINLSGTTSASAAGLYTVIFTLKQPAYYQWASGETGSKTLTWSIAAASWSISNISLTEYGNSGNAALLLFSSTLHPLATTITAYSANPSSYITFSSVGSGLKLVNRNNSVTWSGQANTTTVTLTTSDSNFISTATCTVTTAVWKEEDLSWTLSLPLSVFAPNSDTTLTISASGNFGPSGASTSCTNCSTGTLLYNGNNYYYPVHCGTAGVGSIDVQSGALKTANYIYYRSRTQYVVLSIGTTINVPSWKANVQWKNDYYNVNSSTYWNDWSDVGVSITEGGSGFDAGTYTAHFETNNGYFFPDGSWTATRDWVIVPYQQVCPTPTTPTYNGSVLTPSWNPSPSQGSYFSLSVDGQIDAGTYFATCAIRDSYWNSGNVVWSDGTTTKTRTISWTINPTSNWSGVNASLTAKNTSYANYSDLVSGVFSRDIDNFSVSITTGNCLYNNIDEQKIYRSGSWSGQTASGTVTITPNGNYSGTRTATITIAIWDTRTPTWSLSTTSVNINIGGQADITINNYLLYNDFELLFLINPPSSLCSLSQNGNIIRIVSTGSSGTTSFDIYTALQDDPDNFITYNRKPASGETVVNITISKYSLSWTLSNVSVERTGTFTFTINDIYGTVHTSTGSSSIASISYSRLSTTSVSITISGFAGAQGGLTTTYTITADGTTLYDASTLTANITIVQEILPWELSTVRVGKNKTVDFTLNNIYGAITATTLYSNIATIGYTRQDDSTVKFTVTGANSASVGNTTQYTITAAGNTRYSGKTASATIVIIATDKIVYIYGTFNGETKWHKAIPYIYGNFNNVTKWHKAEAWIYNNGSWHNTVSI